MEFSQADIRQIRNHGLTPEAVEAQIENFRKGFGYLPVESAATVGNGIETLDEARIRELTGESEGRKNLKIVKFVPASGAATRMFKELYEFINEGRRSEGIDRLLENIEKMPFWPELQKVLGGKTDDKSVIGAIIGKEGLGYGSMPKGLIPFHAGRTAAEEHLVEGALYAASAGGAVHIHFTVSPEHLEDFKKLFASVLGKYESRYGVKYDISFSQQKPSTDTIAVTPGNEPLRNGDGSLLFRPAGHGALIENLNEIDADIIFIKTIDNVAPDHLKGDTVKYKKALAGLALELQDKIFGLLRQLDNHTADPDKAAEFIEEQLSYKLPAGLAGASPQERTEYIRKILYRPLRVCGMVRNEGEPGGGPFWVKGADGSLSLQIAESSQIAPERMELMKQATHFNPVDLVCAVKDYKGEKFDLTRYVDPSTGFISFKTKDGQALKAQELPGLWNGAMADWNTVFVEVPISTFSPVKTINDLLRKQHQ